MSFNIVRVPATGVLVDTRRRKDLLKLIALGVVFFAPVDAYAQNGRYSGHCPDGYNTSGEYCSSNWSGGCESMVVTPGTCEMQGLSVCASECWAAPMLGETSCPPGQTGSTYWCGIAAGKGAARCNSQMSMADGCGGYPVCAVECSPIALPPASCNLPWGGTIAHGATVTAYAAGSVACGSSCASQVRSCNNGTLSGTYAASSCSVAACVGCSLPWGGSIGHNASVTAYAAGSVACGSSCQAQTRTCTNGTLSGSYGAGSCSVAACPPASCNLPWGGTLAHGASTTAYAAGSVACGSSCQAQTRTCTNGTLSGSYGAGSCSVAACPPASCNLPWGGTLAHGASTTAYASSSVSCGSSCSAQTRTCTNGSLSGSYGAGSCSVAACPPPPTSPPSGNSCANGAGTFTAETQIGDYDGEAPIQSNPQCASSMFGPSCSPSTPLNTTCVTNITYPSNQQCYAWGKTCVSNSPPSTPPATPPASPSPYPCVFIKGGAFLGSDECLVACTGASYEASQVRTSATTTQYWTHHGGPSNSAPTGNAWGCSGACSGRSILASDIAYINTLPTCSAPPATPPATCALPWGGSIAHGASVTAYQAGSVGCGSTCASQTRTCTNGTLSGSYTASSCSVGACVGCNLPWGGSIGHGASVTAFQTGSVACGSTCSSQTRTCSNGTLSGTYGSQTCSVGVCCSWQERQQEDLWCPGPNAVVPGSTLPATGASCSSHGQEVWGTRYGCNAPGGAHETRTAEGRICVCEGSSPPPAPPSVCAGGSRTWNANGNSCTANVPPLGHGSSTTVSDTTAPATGSASFSCNNGVISAPTGASCIRECAPATVNWSSGSVNCSAGISTTRAHGATATAIDSTHDNTGSATYSCNNGSWSFMSGSCTVPPGCPAQTIAWTTSQSSPHNCSVAIPAMPHRGESVANDQTRLYTGSSAVRCFAGDIQLSLQSCQASCVEPYFLDQTTIVDQTPAASEPCLVSRTSANDAGCQAQCGTVWLYEVMAPEREIGRTYWQYQNSSGANCDRAKSSSARCGGLDVYYQPQTNILNLKTCK